MGRTSPFPPAAVPWLASAALAAACGAFYVLLAPHVVGDGDAAEITLGLATGGVLHPTGYPLYTLLGQLVVAALRAAGAGAPFAANAWAALGGAVALFALHRAALLALPPAAARPARTRFTLAALPVLVLALHPLWVAECTVVEVYGWHVAWACGTTWLLARLLADLGARARPFPLGRNALAWGFVCGVGGAHHATSVFVVGAYSLVLLVALVRAGRFRARALPLALAGALLALSSDLLLLLRAAHPGAAAVWPALEPTWSGLWTHVTAEAYRGFVGHWAPDADQARDLAHGVWPFLVPALALTAAWAFAPRPPAARALPLALLLAAATTVGFARLYGVPDPVSDFMAPLALALIALAPAAAWAWARLARAPAGRAAAALATLALLVPLAFWSVRSAQARTAELEHADALVRQMWDAVPPGPGIFLWASDERCKLQILQQLDGRKPEIDVLDTALLCKPWPQARFVRRYGFDPLANNGPGHAGDPIDPRYFGEPHRLLADRFLARVNETIADSARVPVYLFSSHPLTLRQLNRAHLRTAAAATPAR